MSKMELKTGDKGTVTITVNRILAIIVAVIAILSPIISVTALATAYGSDVDANVNDIQYLKEHHELVDLKVIDLEKSDAIFGATQDAEMRQLDRLEKKLDKLDEKFDDYITSRGN